MTIAQLIECLIGKVAAIKGLETDGTSFNQIDIETIKNELEKLGYEKNCNEYCYNGMTGQRLKIPMFIGPTYYQRLKHLTADKIHCLTGDHDVLTENGWINIQNITKEIKVLTLKSDIELYDYPNHVYKYEDLNEKILYHVKNEDIDTIMTEGHRVYINNNLLIKINQLDHKNNTIYKWYNRSSSFNVNHTTDITIYQSKDNVYCLSVPSEIFYVRRNGKEFWTGNSRARGPNTMLTHQPPEGRSKDGGLRCGEMERDSIIAHGMSKFLKERFLDVSDAYSCYVCDICGLFAQRDKKKDNKTVPQNTDIYKCINCKNKTKISKVIIPYAFKLLIQELMSMNIAPRIRTKQYSL